MTKKPPISPAILNIGRMPAFTALQGLELNPALKAVRELQETGIFQELDSISQSQKALAKALNTPRWVQLQADISGLRGLQLEPEMLSAFQAVNRDLGLISSHISIPVIPAIKQMQEITEALSISLKPFRSDMAQWAIMISEQMNSLQRPWALDGAMAVSISGFAKIGILGDFAQGETPFGAETGALFQDQLFDPSKLEDVEIGQKDDAAVSAGLNPELISMYPAEYSYVLAAAGFSFSFSRVLVPIAEGVENGGEAYDPAHDALLKQVEILLRQLVEERLHSIAGDSWEKQRVSGETRKKWIAVREQEHQNIGKKFRLIQYADFMDLTDIVCQNNNWNEAFRDIFRNRDDFRISMTRLHPIRKALAHARPLARSEVLLLVSEASRVLTVLRKIYPLH